MLLLTYSHSDASAVCRNQSLLKTAGIVYSDPNDGIDPETLPNDTVIVCPLNDISDLQAYHEYLHDHKRVFFQIPVTEHVAATVMRRHIGFSLITPRRQDKTYWKLGCGYDALTEPAQTAWDREWKIITEELLSARSLDGAHFLKNVGQSVSELLPNIIGFL